MQFRNHANRNKTLHEIHGSMLFSHNDEPVCDHEFSIVSNKVCKIHKVGMGCGDSMGIDGFTYQ